MKTYNGYVFSWWLLSPPLGSIQSTHSRCAVYSLRGTKAPHRQHINEFTNANTSHRSASMCRHDAEATARNRHSILMEKWYVLNKVWNSFSIILDQTSMACCTGASWPVFILYFCCSSCLSTSSVACRNSVAQSGWEFKGFSFQNGQTSSELAECVTSCWQRITDKCTSATETHKKWAKQNIIWLICN